MFVVVQDVFAPAPQELVEIILISCFGTEKSDFPNSGSINSEVRIRLRVC